MDWRTVTAVVFLFVFVGLPILIAEIVHIPLEVRDGMPAPVYVFQTEFLILVGAAVVTLAAHQYVRWKRYRPVIHLGAVMILFVVGIGWLLGPVGIGSSQEPLTTQEKQLIQGAGFVLLLYLILFLADYFGNSGDSG